MSRTLPLAVLFLLVALIVCSIGCGGNQPLSATPEINPSIDTEPAVETSWPVTLPADALQPWEAHSASGVNADSILAAGIEWFDTSTHGVSDNHDTSRMTSGDAGSNELSWATYRLRLQGTQPGVVSLDVNPLPMSDGEQSEYWVGLADYAAGCWEWHGPMSDNNVRFGTADGVADGADYLSDVGNLFVCVVAHDGATFDVVCVGANPVDTADGVAPDAPTSLAATAINGGLALTWDAMSAADLAGYRVYYCDEAFTLKDHPGVKTLDTLAGVAHLILPATAQTWVAVAAVDISGNESALSNVVSAAPLSGNMPVVQVTASVPSCLVRSSVELTATGADRYDWDLDGDGVFEVTGDTMGLQEAYTGIVGVVRPAVLGYTGAAGLAGGGVSVMLGTNSRPAASATANPQNGQAPLTVTFTGDAADVEDSLADLDFAWDFDGDGIYEANTDTLTPSAQEYTTPGIFGVKFRVSDTEGEWDVDTVPVLVQPADDPANQAPVADLDGSVDSGNPPLQVSFDASNSTDDDGEIVEYAWDFTGDGIYTGITDGPTYTYEYTEPGLYVAKVRVEDDDGDRATDTFTVTVNAVGNTPPVADVTASPTSGDAPLLVSFDADGSSDTDGSIVRVDWDFDGDGLYEIYDGDGESDYTYSAPGAYTARCRVTDDDGDQAVDTVDITVTMVNSDPPVAILEGDKTELFIGMSGPAEINFDASSSYDNDSTTLTYYFDPAGDGDYVDNGTSPTYEATYNNRGIYLAKLKVEDSEGNAACDTLQITVREFETRLVDTAFHVGRYTSITEVEGKPAIAYYDVQNQQLRYTRALDNNCTSWSTPVVVDATAAVGKYACLRVINFYPSISYYDQTNGNLKYALAVDEYGLEWNTPVVVDNSTDVGQYTSMCKVNGRPAISYYDVANTDLKYVRAADSIGSTWNTPVLVHSTAFNIGQYSSMAVVENRPAISYYDATNGDLLYARADDQNGSSWSTSLSVQNTNIVGQYTSLAIVDGYPAIAFYYVSNNQLRYIRATSSTGLSWGTPVVVDNDGYSGTYNTLDTLNGIPVIGYYAPDYGQLRYVEASDATGSTWNSYVMIQGGDNGNWCSMAICNGKPVFSSYDAEALGLSVSIPMLE